VREDSSEAARLVRRTAIRGEVSEGGHPVADEREKTQIGETDETDESDVEAHKNQIGKTQVGKTQVGEADEDDVEAHKWQVGKTQVGKTQIG
jgi:hypothetical protein